jgi:hypothetical protein
MKLRNRRDATRRVVTRYSIAGLVGPHQSPHGPSGGRAQVIYAMDRDQYREAWVRARSRMLMLEVDYLAAHPDGPRSIYAVQHPMQAGMQPQLPARTQPHLPASMQSRVRCEQQMASAPTSLLRTCTPLISPGLGLSAVGHYPPQGLLGNAFQARHCAPPVQHAPLPAPRKHPRDEPEDPRDEAQLPEINVGLAERAPSIDQRAQAQMLGGMGGIGSRSLDDDDARSASWAAGFLLSLSPGATPPTMSPCNSRMASQDLSLQDLGLQADDWTSREDAPTGAAAPRSSSSSLSPGGTSASTSTTSTTMASSSSSLVADMWKKRQRLSHDE